MAVEHAQNDRIHDELAARPLIGISTYRETATWGAWSQTADLLTSRYTDNLRAAGGLAALLPPGAADPQRDADATVRRLDGLMLAGGPDVDPALYGAPAHPTTDVPRTDRDAWELALIRAAMARDLPVLAICRGMQVLNVALGGTLIQHLPDVVGHEEHRAELGGHPTHPVRVEGSSVLARALGTTVDAPTHHHQAVDQLGAGLVATAWAADGIVEAVTCPGQGWLNGVQWHPEVDGEQPLFRAFVAACAGVDARVNEAAA